MVLALQAMSRMLARCSHVWQPCPLQTPSSMSTKICSAGGECPAQLPNPVPLQCGGIYLVSEKVHSVVTLAHQVSFCPTLQETCRFPSCSHCLPLKLYIEEMYSKWFRPRNKQTNDFQPVQVLDMLCLLQAERKADPKRWFVWET